MNLDNLIKRCKKQKLDAQSQLYKLYKDDLFILCLKYCRNKEEAQDNLQDAFLEIFQKIKYYKGIGSFEGWMKRITINKAIDKYKSKHEINFEINDNILKDTEFTIENIEAIPLEDILFQVQNLPSQYRLVFTMYELDDYSHKEIAELLNISESTSKSNLHRAKKLLQTKIQRPIKAS
ncbi:RNA polymerase sigma factor [uncultured Winogradskyella sp.]|uniref:RNA polymerase sigma factor n=1 Tax=uncultured Winogradskyella sp. TaxID=395353 RepID=UPI002614FD26|nr:RNA polymerase sigma factor [uncultured Winogradskyella sp.]